jgi:hypothetical protein
MRIRFILALACALVLAAAPASADPGHGLGPGGPVTDDPSGHEDPLAGFDGAGLLSVESFLGGQPPGKRADKRSRNISLVGAYKGEHFNLGVYGDVAGYRNLAFVGKWRGECPGDGVDIIDISDPRNPVKISSTLDYVDTSMEDMQVINIAGRDILGVGLQDCGNIVGEGTVGLELYDITDPHNPEFLHLFNGKDFADLFPSDLEGSEQLFGHVHEFDFTATPGGRVLALLAAPNLEANTARGFPFDNGIGDLLIVDITDPANPFLASHWGVLQEPELGLDVWFAVQQGADARTLLHSVRANQNGTLAYLSYWDAGFIILDISDPENPVYLGRTEYPPDAEGNAHSVADARGGNILVAADEDFSPFQFVFTSNAFEGERVATEAAFTPAIVDLPGREMTGEVVHVGRGCPADPAGSGLAVDDPYLADPAGKIALIQRGACRFDHKVVRAQLAGAIGAIVYGLDGDESLVLMGGENPTTMPDGSIVDVTIPAVFVQNSTGVLLRDGTPPVTASAKADFVGWGFLRIFDISDPANPVELSNFATPNTFNEAVATEGTWSVHNPEVVGNTVYASWYSDGVRIIDISRPKAPREIGFWTGAGAPADAPAVNIWSVVPHNGLLLASDRNYGLYILQAGRP